MAPLIHDSPSNVDFHTNDGGIDTYFYEQSSSQCQSSPSLSLSQENDSGTRKDLKTMTKKKTVQFSKYSLQYTVPSLDEYTPAELQSMHLTAKDYERIRDENAIIVRSATAAWQKQTGKSFSFFACEETDRFSIRGLEPYFEHISQQRRLEITSYVSLVLQEQEYFRRRFVSAVSQDDIDATMESPEPPKAIVSWLHQLTSQSALRAYYTGLWDAQH